MANTFKDISQFTLKSAATGTEEFQVSATEKVTAQQIADLASSGLNVYTVSESEAQNQKIDASRIEELKKSVLILFPNEVSYVPYIKVSVDNSKAYFITGSIPINSQGEPGINNGEEPPFEQVNTVMIEANLTTYDITILPYPIINKSWLKEAVQVTAFTESALLALLSNYKTGDFRPFYTGNVTASTDNQFPESGVFNGFISVGSNEGDYCQIFAFKTGSPKAYIGACIGSTTQWTALGDSSEGRGPIPGYKTLVSSWSSTVTTGSTGIINFREEIPQASRILVVAQIRSSPTGSATIRANVPLTLASISDSGQGILFDLSLQYLATGTNIGSIRLICTSLITGANGVQGMNTIVQSNNLANAGDIIQLSLYYK